MSRFLAYAFAVLGTTMGFISGMEARSAAAWAAGCFMWLMADREERSTAPTRGRTEGET
jgi:uncharacterized membrane protein